MKKLKTGGKSIIFVGLANSFVSSFSSIVSDTLGKYYLDVDDLIDYSIMNREETIEKCGKHYVEEQEIKVINSLNDYENVIMSVSLSTFNAYKDLIRENKIVVYARLSEKYLLSDEMKNEGGEQLNELLFKERDKFLKNNCDIIVNCDINNIDNAVSELLNNLIFER